MPWGMVRFLLLSALLLLALARPAAAIGASSPRSCRRSTGNPADRLLSIPIEDSPTTAPRRCTTRRGPG